MIKVKIFNGNEIRKTRIPKQTSFSKFKQHLHTLFKDLVEPYRLKYLDEEFDWVTVESDEEFQEALEQQQILKIKVLQQKQNLGEILKNVFSEENQLHTNVKCDGCAQFPVKGNRYKCCVCPNFDYCEKCYQSNKQKHGHEFKKMFVFDNMMKTVSEMFGGEFWKNQQGVPPMWMDFVSQLSRNCQNAPFAQAFEQMMKNFTQAFNTTQQSTSQQPTAPQQTQQQHTQVKQEKVIKEEKPVPKQQIKVEQPKQEPIDLTTPLTYEEELLISMGFTDKARNKEMLKKHNNDLQKVVAEYLK